MTVHVDQVFASLDRDHGLERIAGGNETEVYRTDDYRFVVKLKSELGSDVLVALADARTMRAAAEQYAACLGPSASIPNWYLISRDAEGRVQVLVIQPFLFGAQQLHDIRYSTLNDAERAVIAQQLREIIQRSLEFYRSTGSMPDLYGRSSKSRAERARMNGPHMLPWRMWSFLVKRNLLRSHNLMRTADPAPRIVLVDYDFVRRGRFYRRVYYAVRKLLFWRDYVLILLMRYGWSTPRGD